MTGTAEGACVLWAKGRGAGGYGQRKVNGRMVLAHKYAYEARHGPVPDGLELDHLCGNPSCVNVDHLEAVTHAENCRRGRKAKISMEQAQEIRDALSTGESAPKIAARYGVSSSAVYLIKRGRRWRTSAEVA